MVPNPASHNVYEILGVGRGATTADVRDVYRRLALQYHPDMVAGAAKQDAAALFTRITKAYDVLQDEEVRRKYDHLLDRGVVPDLDDEVGELPPHRGLSEILNQIRALDIDAKENLLLARIDADLRRRVLDPTLFRRDDLHEQVVDVVRFRRVVAREQISLPPGRLAEGWLVLTDLRVILLSKYTHEYQTGNVKHTDTYHSIQLFLFLSMKDFLLHEEGRVTTGRFVEVADEDGRRIKVDFPAGRVARLLLLAGAYRLPLKVRARADREREFRRGFGRALAPLLAWCAPFVLMVGREACFALWGHTLGEGPASSPWFSWQTIADTYGFLTGLHLTALAFFLTPLLCLRAWLRLDRAWNRNRAGSFFGPLPVDYALGSDAITQARQGGGPLAEAYIPPDELALGWLSQRLRDQPWGDGPLARTPAFPRGTGVATPGAGA